MNTRRKVAGFRDRIAEMQCELAKGHIGSAQAYAAAIDRDLEEWHFDLMHILPSERQKYRSPNGYYYPVRNLQRDEI